MSLSAPKSTPKVPQCPTIAKKLKQSAPFCGAFWCFCQREAPQPNHRPRPIFTPKTYKKWRLSAIGYFSKRSKHLTISKEGPTGPLLISPFMVMPKAVP
jgi:hypothetical protein